MSLFVRIENKRQAARVVGSYRCGCGKAKRPLMSVCRTCFEKLPPALRERLGKMLKGHFVVALAQAQRLLGHKEVVLPPLPDSPIPSHVTDPQDIGDCDPIAEQRLDAADIELQRDHPVVPDGIL